MRPASHLKASKGWWCALGVCGLGTVALMVGIWELLAKGVGIWGINVPVAWAFAITNFVWWIGIGHAGTFISAILFLVRQDLRAAISRFAETMTIFAVACAGVFPLAHLGRPWFFYWLLPYYDVMHLWPQFRSPLVWDVFAVSTYLIVSLCFWYVGLLPDLAAYRDSHRSARVQRLYAVLALGWRGSAGQWRGYRAFYGLMAALAAPLVISVHSIVGMDFAAAILPGWHSTIFPPYFVAGAIFSGFAMVVTLGVPLRKALALEEVITLAHLDLCARFILAMGLFVAYGYFVEVFSAFVGGDEKEIAMTMNRYFGHFAVTAWIMLFCNVLVPQLLWIKQVRTAPWVLFGLSLLINVGMWCERFVIVAGTLEHEALPSSEHIYLPTIWDWTFLFGSMGMFGTLFLLFARFFPVLALSELRENGRHLDVEAS